jgi:hypothetical protein
MNIYEMAREAGFAERDSMFRVVFVANKYDLEKFAALVAAQEREECAKFVDHILKEGGGTYGDAIRARGTK